MWNDRGNAEVRRGYLREAEEAYRMALREDPDFLPALRNLAALQLSRERTGDSARLFRRILDQLPNDALAHYGLGAAHDQAGRREAALEEYEEALRLDPKLRLVSENPNLVNNRHLEVVRLRLYLSEGGSIVLPLVSSDSGEEGRP